uniref:Uncharacterized protein n=1 Tax=Clastoptera arizonana TaxID=38151 RepID=A0A1B6DRD8_9HEMI
MAALNDNFCCCSERPIVNRSLIQTIKWDLKNLARTIAELESWLALTVTLKSNFGRKTKYQKESSALILVDDASNKPNCIYLTSLYEEINERLSIFINLTLEFLHIFPVISTEFASALIKESEFPSISSICRMLWERIQFLHQHLIKQIVRNTEECDILNVTRGTQTQICSLVYCESCSLSTSLVRFLVQTINCLSVKYNIKNLNISRVKKELMPRLLDLSEWGAMSQWVEAISKDITIGVDILNTTQRQNKKFQKDLKLQSTKRNNDLEVERYKILQLKSAVSESIKKFDEGGAKILF